MSDLLLLSGGIDSSAVAAWLRPAICLTIDYGQRAVKAETRASSQVCKELKLRHEILTARIPDLSAGDMSEQGVSLHSVHSEFWPFRNQYLITLGAMFAIKHGCDSVLIGTVFTDKRHMDGSHEFITSLDRTLALQEGNIRLAAPAASMTSTELVHQSKISDGILGWAHSCHIGEFACGHCRGCQKHSEVMTELGWFR
jgi:7-cyano-7-deazaguanine synthase